MMKKLIAFVGLITWLGSAAQDGSQTVIKANILSPIVRTGSFFIERAIAEDKSVQLGVGFTAASIDDVKLNGLFFTPEFRFYLSESQSAPAGFYIGPFLRYQNLKIKEEVQGGPNDEATLNTFGGGLVAGRQWLFKDRIALDIFLGPTYNAGDLKVTSGNIDDVPGSIQGFGLRAGVTFGVAF